MTTMDQSEHPGRGRGNIGVAWTTERVERLKWCWADGWAASAIAADLGGVTRNAVLGKVDRLDLPAREKDTRNRPRSKKRNLVPKLQGKRLRIVPNGVGHVIHEVTYIDEPLLSSVDDQDIPPEQRRTLLELTNETCRWPCGDPGTQGFFFCGGQTAPSLPYCKFHCRIAYQAPPKPTKPNVYIPRRNEAA